jgi:hypothetical protein
MTERTRKIDPSSHLHFYLSIYLVFQPSSFILHFEECSMQQPFHSQDVAIASQSTAGHTPRILHNRVSSRASGLRPNTRVREWGSPVMGSKRQREQGAGHLRPHYRRSYQIISIICGQSMQATRPPGGSRMVDQPGDLTPRVRSSADCLPQQTAFCIPFWLPELRGHGFKLGRCPGMLWGPRFSGMSEAVAIK